MLRKKRKWMGIALAQVIAVLLMGCSKDDIIEKKADLSKAVDKANIEEGLYILTAKGKFYKPNKKNQSFEDVSLQADSSRVIWSVKGEKAIPTLYQDDKLVYFSKKALENDFVIEKFKNMGYSIGAYGLSAGTNGDINISYQNLIDSSSLDAQIKEVAADNEIITLAEVSGERVREKEMKRGGIISGLKKNKAYIIGIYKGTYYGEMEIKADTQFFVSEKTDYINGFKRTKSGYVVVDAGNLKNGYYSINGEGLFQVLDKKR